MLDRNNFFDWYNKLGSLNEDINDEVRRNFEHPVEASRPVVDKTKDKILSDLIIDEKEAIDGYNNAIDRLGATDEITDKAEDVLKHISEEELEHIEELSKIVADEEHEVQTESLADGRLLTHEEKIIDALIDELFDICGYSKEKLIAVCRKAGMTDEEINASVIELKNADIPAENDDEGVPIPKEFLDRANAGYDPDGDTDEYEFKY